MTDEKTPPETPATPEAPKAPAADAAPAAPKPAPAPRPAVPAGPKKWEPTGEVVESAATRALAAAFGADVAGVKSPCGEASVLVPKARLVEVLTFLKGDPACAFDYLSDMTGTHYPNNDKPFEAVYHLFSTTLRHSLRVKVQLADGEPLPTATGVWRTANWMEREAHDLVGLNIVGHPDLRTILLPDGFEGHPLRKEFPVGGAQEEMIRSNRYGKPVYLPDDVEEARKIVEERRHE